MIAANALRGYEDFFVITAFTVEPHSIHTRQPIASLEDLKGLKIRANNPTEAATFEKLGMRGIVMPANQIADAIGSGAIDGAALPPAMLVVKTIVTLGRELNMRVTVEGVETAHRQHSWMGSTPIRYRASSLDDRSRASTSASKC